MTTEMLAVRYCLLIIGLGLIGMAITIRRLRQLPKRTQGRWTRMFTWKYIYAQDIGEFVRFKFVWRRTYIDWKDGRASIIYRERMD